MFILEQGCARAMSEIRFVDRNVELKALKEFCSSFRALPLYVYGPEGCGKTRLLKEFINLFNEYFGDEGIAIYIDALARKGIDEAVMGSLNMDVKALRRVALEAIKDLNLPLGHALAESIGSLMDMIAEKLFRRKLEDKYVVIAIDDVVKSIGMNEVEKYIKWLYETMWKLSQEYRPRALNFIVTTSEGQSLELISRHRHAGISILWNLDRKSFEELFHELNPPDDVDYEDVGRLIGGNPGKLIELAKKYNWNIDMWFKSLLRRLRPLAFKIASRNLTEELKLLIEDPDNTWHRASPRMEELYRILVNENLFMYKWHYTIDQREIPEDNSIGIGRYYAWQIPAYREALKQLVED